ncbi:Hsp20/alpha crystallin family protein [Salmonirosea aquatica]|uniref:Hsp20 family protein n=1 Tax=Salmonirosea aquatica TaxID=2654236 RepID=A0A7C9BM17_9BACT|nr:Hsp20 family protein [Cytophagaceae bacterium SJW1-29]
MEMETAFPIAQRMGRSLSNTLFDPLTDAFGKFFHDPFTLSMPKANVTESTDEVKIDLAAPGLEKEDFSIKADGKVLTVSAEKESSTSEGEEETNYRREYSYTSFSRSFVLPDSALVDDTQANYQNGVLHIRIAKKDAPKRESKTIAID